MTASATPADRRAVLLGAPVDLGGGLRGCAMGSTALRVAAIGERLAELGIRVADHGDLAIPSAVGEDAGFKNGAAIAAWTRVIDNALAGVTGSGAIPLVLGGDHSLSMGSVNGVSRALAGNQPVFVLWIDAHADFNTPSTSPSGNLHGMALAYLCDEPELRPFAPGVIRAPVDPDRVCVFGARSIDRGERELLRTRGVDVVDMRAIDETGIAAPLQQFLARVAAVGGHLHVSLDVDSLDPEIAPGVGTTVPGGLTYREAHLMMELVHESGLLGSMDVVELNPFLDERGRSAVVLAELVASAFGQTVIERPSRSPLRRPAPIANR